MPVPQTIKNYSLIKGTGKMPVPQTINFPVGSRVWASCPPLKDLLIMVQDVS
ncbi:hypothetical protein QUA83_00355 [Microcoleus sp. K1-B1]|uniref:hypothetical protein n=1 Tax=Microcoleus sp. K1-B6 TaxID=2818787 RepID=UPI002FD85EFF